jgi:hypothetical protein
MTKEQFEKKYRALLNDKDKILNFKQEIHSLLELVQLYHNIEFQIKYQDP